MLSYRGKRNGHNETDMFKRFSMMGFILGEESQDIINKAKWRIHFIDTKQQLEGNYEPEQNKGERLKQRLVVRFSTNSLSWVRLNLSELRKIEHGKGNS